MATTNHNYDKLGAGYLFPEIARRAKAFSEAHAGVQLHRLGIGDTTQPLAPTVVRALQEAAGRLGNPQTYTGYGDYEGERYLREAIRDLYRERNVELGLDEIFASDGAKSDSGNIQTIFDADNVVAVQDPAYPVYVDTNVMAGRTESFNTVTGQYVGVVYMPCNEYNGFFPDLPTEKVDLIYICSPNNPTGAVATREQLQQFVDYACRRRAVIIFDAAYSAFISAPDLPRSIYEIPHAKECAIEINSFSKSAGFTGVRLGWAVVPKTLVAADAPVGKINALWYRRQSTFFNGASNVVQYAGAAALSAEGRRECQVTIDYYMQNARIIREGLTSLGLVCHGGDNAPYIWAKTPGGLRSWDFFDQLLQQAHVVTTPGSGFGPSGEGYIRLSAFGHRESTEQAIASIKANLKVT
jgi:LL-diaminopimelate aminotransferase